MWTQIDKIFLLIYFCSIKLIIFATQNEIKANINELFTTFNRLELNSLYYRERTYSVPSMACAPPRKKNIPDSKQIIADKKTSSPIDTTRLDITRPSSPYTHWSFASGLCCNKPNLAKAPWNLSCKCRKWTQYTIQALTPRNSS